MAKRTKTSTKKSASRKTASKGYRAEKFSFNDLFTKKHRPIHAAALGVLLVFLPGILAGLGILLIVSAALVYAFRAFKSETR